MNNALKLILSVGIPVAGGLAAGLLSGSGDGSWYKTINKPTWNPPSWVFGPVWTTLYILMGIALYLVWRKEDNSKMKGWAIGLFFFQLALNFAWSFIFFSLHEIGWSLVEMLLMWICILLTIFMFARYSKLSAWLLVPYISWVSFATVLTWTIWLLN